MARRKTLDDAERVDVARGAVRPRFVCVAENCPCIAAIAYGEDFICRFHDGSTRRTWDRITAALRNRVWLLALAEHVGSDEWRAENPDWAWRARAFCDSPARREFSPSASDEAHPRNYAARLNGALGIAVSSLREKPEDAPSHLVGAEALRSIGSLVGARPSDYSEEARLEREAIQAESGGR